MGDLIQFVDGIGADPTVLLDLNEDDLWSTHLISDAPALVRHATAFSALTDGERGVHSTRGDRMVELRFDLMATSQEQKAVELQKLARIIDRRRAWLKYQPVGAVKPVFFRTKRGDIARLTSIDVTAAVTDIELNLPADTYTYGEPVQGSVTVETDPSVAEGSHPGSFLLDNVQGDVATPLRMRIGNATRRMMVASVAGPDIGPWVDPVVETSAAPSGWTMSTVASSSRVGGSNKRLQAGSGVASSLSWSGIFPTFDGLPFGEYRVLVLARASVADRFRIQAFVGGGKALTDPRVLGTVWSWIDCGIARVPRGSFPSDFAPDQPGEIGLYTDAITLRLSALSGVANGNQVEFDAALLLPCSGPDTADDSSFMVLRGTSEWGNSGVSSNLQLGGPDHVVGSGAVAGPFSTPTVNEWSAEGGMPQVVPGQPNRITVTTGLGPADLPVTAGVKCECDWLYYPRYLTNVRPSAS